MIWMCQVDQIGISVNGSEEIKCWLVAAHMKTGYIAGGAATPKNAASFYPKHQFLG